jgi:hypothetical protein
MSLSLQKTWTPFSNGVMTFYERIQFKRSRRQKQKIRPQAILKTLPGVFKPPGSL